MLDDKLDDRSFGVWDPYVVYTAYHDKKPINTCYQPRGSANQNVYTNTRDTVHGLDHIQWIESSHITPIE